MGISSLFDNVISDLGGIRKEEMNLENVIFLMTQSLLNQNVAKSVQNKSSIFQALEFDNVVDAYLLMQQKSGLNIANQRC